MVAPGSYDGKRIGLFVMTSVKLTQLSKWLNGVQQTATKWDESESGRVIEQVDLPTPNQVGSMSMDTDPEQLLITLTHHIRCTFAPADSTFLSRSFLVADEKSLQTNSLIVVSEESVWSRC